MEFSISKTDMRINGSMIVHTTSGCYEWWARVKFVSRIWCKAVISNITYNSDTFLCVKNGFANSGRERMRIFIRLGCSIESFYENRKCFYYRKKIAFIQQNRRERTSRNLSRNNKMIVCVQGGQRTIAQRSHQQNSTHHSRSKNHRENQWWFQTWPKITIINDNNRWILNCTRSNIK